MSDNEVVIKQGMGLPTVLFVVFLVLKLCKVIDWSWWWVTAPLWIPFGIVLVFIAIAFVIGVIASIFGAR